MKILEAGTMGEKWSLQHRCTAWGNVGNGCNALLELEYDDLRYYQGTGDHFGVYTKEPAVSFKCPCCGNITDLGLNDWPVGYKELKLWSKEWQEAKPIAA